MGFTRKAAEAAYRTYFATAASLTARCRRAAIEGRSTTTVRLYAAPTLRVLDLCRRSDHTDKAVV